MHLLSYMHIWIHTYLHFCVHYIFALLLKHQGWTYWLMLSVKNTKYILTDLEHKINDALSQHLKLLVDCCIDTYSLCSFRGKSQEQLMTFIFSFILPYWGRWKWYPRALRHLSIGNNSLIPEHPTFWMCVLELDSHMRWAWHCKLIFISQWFEVFLEDPWKAIFRGKAIVPFYF